MIHMEKFPGNNGWLPPAHFLHWKDPLSMEESLFPTPGDEVGWCKITSGCWPVPLPSYCKKLTLSWPEPGHFTDTPIGILCLWMISFSSISPTSSAWLVWQGKASGPQEMYPLLPISIDTHSALAMERNLFANNFPACSFFGLSSRRLRLDLWMHTVVHISSLHFFWCLPFQSQGYTVLCCFPKIVGLFLNPCGKRVQHNWVFHPICGFSHSNANSSWLRCPVDTKESILQVQYQYLLLCLPRPFWWVSDDH